MQGKRITDTFRKPERGETLLHEGGVGTPWTTHAVFEFTPTPGPYVNTGPEHMPLGLADRKAHDARLAERGERDES